jgi:hypothetical protein
MGRACGERRKKDVEMANSSRRTCMFAMAALCLVSVPLAAAPANDKDIIRQARNAYYSLQAHGYDQFRCTVTPNWRAVLQGQIKSDPGAVNRGVDILKQLVFVATVKNGAAATMTHNTVTPTNANMAKGLEQIYSGMEQMVAGFFATWAGYVVTPLLPAVDDVYRLQDKGGQWRLSYKEGAVDIVTIMGKDLVMRETTFSAPTFISTLKPQFVHASEGLLLSGYHADYRGITATERDVTVLDVLITYQKVNGLEVPKKLTIGGSQNGSPFRMETLFSHCTASKH